MEATQTTAVDAPVVEPATEHVVAKTTDPEDAHVAHLNRELDLVVSASYGMDRKNRTPWVDHAANFSRLVEEIGGYTKVWPGTINSFVYLCYDRSVKAKVFDVVTRAYGEIFADPERLVAEENRMVAFVALAFSTNKNPSMTAIYAAHGLEVPEAVSAKIAKGEKREAEYAERKAAEQGKIELARKVQAFRHPRLHRGMTLLAKGQEMLASGYTRVSGQSKPGVLYFEGKDPETGELVKKPIFGEGPAVPGMKPALPRGKSIGQLRQHQPETAPERAHRESERNSRREQRIAAQPRVGASAKKGSGNSASASGVKK